MCERCRGQREVTTSIDVEAALTPAVLAVGRAYARLRNHGTWPEGPSVGDNAATFVDAVEILDGRLSRIEREERDRQRKDAERERRKARKRL